MVLNLGNSPAGSNDGHRSRFPGEWPFGRPAWHSQAYRSGLRGSEKRQVWRFEGSKNGTPRRLTVTYNVLASLVQFTVALNPAKAAPGATPPFSRLSATRHSGRATPPLFVAESRPPASRVSPCLRPRRQPSAPVDRIPFSALKAPGCAVRCFKPSGLSHEQQPGLSSRPHRRLGL